jgi:hypothetical protein
MLQQNNNNSMRINAGEVEFRLKHVFNSLGGLLAAPETDDEMYDKTKGEWTNHLHMRSALLGSQLMTTRDKMNYIEKVKKLQSDEDKNEFEVLKVTNIRACLINRIASKRSFQN